MHTKMMAALILILTCFSGWGEDNRKAKHDFLGIVGADVFGLDADESALMDAEAERWDHLDELFTGVLASRVGLERGFWEGYADILFFRVLLVQATMNGEQTCRDRQICADIQAGLSAPAIDGVGPLCPTPQMCERQHGETMAICSVILDQKCPRIPRLRGKCEELREEAYKTCVRIAQCQLDCCNKNCSGLNCPKWVLGEPVQPCTNRRRTDGDPGLGPG